MKITSIPIVICLLMLSAVSNGQDIIRFHYYDTIVGDVVEINNRYVKYLPEDKPHGPVFSINRKRIAEIEYPNGRIDKISPDKKTKTYRPGIYLAITGSLDDPELGNFNTKGDTYFGLGHSGLFRVGQHGLGVIYNAQVQFTNFDRDINVNEGYPQEAFMGHINVNAGLEYRLRIYREFGLFADAYIGYMYFKPFNTGHYWDSPTPAYGGTIGIFVYDVQWSFSYIQGEVDLKNVHPDSDVIFNNHLNLKNVCFRMTYLF